jgi:hypothetical protein
LFLRESCSLFCLRVSGGSRPRQRAPEARWGFHTTSRAFIRPNAISCQQFRRNGDLQRPSTTRQSDNLASGIRIVPPADPREAKELREGKTRDQRAAADAGCEEDEFFGNDLHSISCGGRDEGGGTSSLNSCVAYRQLEWRRIESRRSGRHFLLTPSRYEPILLVPANRGIRSLNYESLPFASFAHVRRLRE